MALLESERLTREELRHEAWLEEAEGLTGMNLAFNDDALIAFYEGKTPQQFSDSLWVAPDQSAEAADAYYGIRA